MWASPRTSVRLVQARFCSQIQLCTRCLEPHLSSDCSAAGQTCGLGAECHLHGQKYDAARRPNASRHRDFTKPARFTKSWFEVKDALKALSRGTLFAFCERGWRRGARRATKSTAAPAGTPTNGSGSGASALAGMQETTRPAT